MACSIAIGTISGSGLAPAPTITVSGTATECPQVEVTLTYGALSFNTTVTVGADGSWSAVFENTTAPCGASVSATSRCTTDPSCVATLTAPVDCLGCPVVEIAVTEGECNEAGTARELAFAVNVTPGPGPGSTITEIEFEPGVFSGATMSTSYTVTYAYPPGSAPTPVLHIVSPLGCPDVAIPVPTVSACAAACPGVALTSVEGACPVPDRRTVLLIASLTGTGTVDFQWDFGDGSPVVTDSTTVPGFATQPHAFPTAATHTVRFQITNPPDCPEHTITVGPLTPCVATPVEPEPPTGTPTPPSPTPPRGPRDDFDWTTLSCAALWWLWIFLGILVFVLPPMTRCLAVLIPFEVYMGIVTGFMVAWLLYGLLCPDKPCGWSWLGLSMVFIGAAWALIWYSGCRACGANAIVGLAYLLLANVFLGWWRAECQKAPKDAVKHITQLVWTMFLGPVITWVMGIPGAWKCFGFWGVLDAIHEGTSIDPGVGGLLTPDALDCACAALRTALR